MMQNSGESNGGNILYPVHDFDINLETKTTKKPKKPINKREYDLIKSEVLDDCIKAYISRMRLSGLVNNRTIEELTNDAYVSFSNFALNKFDKSRCGKISKFNYSGKDKPKKLSWYFYNYFCLSLNGVSRDYKKSKKRRLGDPEEYYRHGFCIDQESLEDSRFHSRIKVKDLMDKLNLELHILSPDARELFRMRIVEGYNSNESKKHIKEYRKANVELQSFLNAFVVKYKDVASDIFESNSSFYESKIKKKSRKRPPKKRSSKKKGKT